MIGPCETAERGAPDDQAGDPTLVMPIEIAHSAFSFGNEPGSREVLIRTASAIKQRPSKPSDDRFRETSTPLQVSPESAPTRASGSRAAPVSDAWTRYCPPFALQAHRRRVLSSNSRSDSKEGTTTRDNASTNMDSVVNLRVYRTTDGGRGGPKKRVLLTKRHGGDLIVTDDVASVGTAGTGSAGGASPKAAESRDAAAAAIAKLNFTGGRFGSMLGLGTRRSPRGDARGFQLLNKSAAQGDARLKQTRAGVSLFKNDDKRTAVEALRYDGSIEDHEDPEMLLDLMEERTLALFEAYDVDPTGVIEAAPTAGSRPGSGGGPGGMERSDSAGSIHSSGTQKSKMKSVKSDGERSSSTKSSNKGSASGRGSRRKRGIRFRGDKLEGKGGVMAQTSAADVLAERLDAAIAGSPGGTSSSWGQGGASPVGAAGDVGADAGGSTLRSPHRPKSSPVGGARSSPRGARESLRGSNPKAPHAEPPKSGAGGARPASAVTTRAASAARPDSASVATRRVLEIVSDLTQNTLDDDKRLNHQLRTSSFNWSQMLRLKSEALQSIGSDPTEGSCGAGMWRLHDVAREMRAARARVVERTTSRHAENVARHRWLGKVLQKARDSTKGKPVPECMLRFLGGIHSLIADGCVRAFVCARHTCVYVRVDGFALRPGTNWMSRSTLSCAG